MVPSGSSQLQDYFIEHTKTLKIMQTIVGYHALSAISSPSNFHLATSFLPERWCWLINVQMKVKLSAYHLLANGDMLVIVGSQCT